MKSCRKLLFCRICGGEFEDKSLALNESPLANELYPDRKSAMSADSFPLEIVMCKSCRHIQLRHIVNPERLFSNYVYASGTSSIFREHFQELALRIMQLVPKGKILEIGSNDGTLMDSLKAKGFEVVGIEPSATLTKRCEERGLDVYTDFLNDALSMSLRLKYKEFDVVVGNNVFAHIDELPAAIGLVESLLSEEGYFIFEVAYSLRMANELLFDTIYHEHMSYHSALSLSKFMPALGFEIVDIEEISTHGGSIRVICRKNPTGNKDLVPNETVKKLIDREIKANLDTAQWMEEFERRLFDLKSLTKSAITEECANTAWFGYGAPAKAVTFINEFNLGDLGLIGIIDDNPDKQGKYLPKSGIKITSRIDMISQLNRGISDAKLRCVVFPWNLSSEIVDRLTDFVRFKVELVWFLPKHKRVELVNENA
jgi:2-polyprenyl-3-methyl-5-hydroxy-6-metoxy-1,4-benzoquinol methylase